MVPATCSRSFVPWAFLACAAGGKPRVRRISCLEVVARIDYRSEPRADDLFSCTRRTASGPDLCPIVSRSDEKRSRESVPRVTRSERGCMCRPYRAQPACDQYGTKRGTETEKRRLIHKSSYHKLLKVAAPARFERATFPLGGERSIQLSYGATRRHAAQIVARHANA